VPATTTPYFRERDPTLPGVRKDPRKRKTTRRRRGILGIPGFPGCFATPPPKIGGEGGFARA